MNRTFICCVLSLLLGPGVSGTRPVMEDHQQASQVSLYKETCCNHSISGKAFKMEYNTNTVALFFCPNSLLELCDFSRSCEEILHLYPTASSGYYTITLSNGSMMRTFCDMEGVNCDQQGGWTRIAHLNMTQPSATCPVGLRTVNYSNIDHHLCGKEGDRGGCSSVHYTAPVIYTKVCGKVRGYQFGSPDGIGPDIGQGLQLNIGINDSYLDGVSITYSTNPRKHLWTYAAGVNELVNGLSPVVCPCSKQYNTEYPPPAFIGQDYYCESGNPQDSDWSPVLYADDPLWDGEQCSEQEEPCCNNSTMPWFIKTLTEETKDSVEVRVCRNENEDNEDVLLETIEIFVK